MCCACCRHVLCMLSLCAVHAAVMCCLSCRHVFVVLFHLLARCVGQFAAMCHALFSCPRDLLGSSSLHLFRSSRWTTCCCASCAVARPTPAPPQHSPAPFAKLPTARPCTFCTAAAGQSAAARRAGGAVWHPVLLPHGAGSWAAFKQHTSVKRFRHGLSLITRPAIAMTMWQRRC